MRAFARQTCTHRSRKAESRTRVQRHLAAGIGVCPDSRIGLAPSPVSCRGRSICLHHSLSRQETRMLHRPSHRHELRHLRLAVSARADLQARNSSKLRKTQDKGGTKDSAHLALMSNASRTWQTCLKNSRRWGPFELFARNANKRQISPVETCERHCFACSGARAIQRSTYSMNHSISAGISPSSRARTQNLE